MSNKMWDVLLEHAKTCILSGKLYVYYPGDVRNIGVVFNNIYELSGLIVDNEFHSADSLSDSQKVCYTAFIVYRLFSYSFKYWLHLSMNNDGLILRGIPMSITSLQIYN